ncbi:NAD(+) synthase [uncultured Peptoniphilus sp.]|uniref:NAD(+) synthase n=1 Tax=uncultured Peptoniphilus sp. TaxID=254354 RepID=UPI002804F3B2|nr:NAD(+) synthase [uncultured Peptoniphilus sp.]
MIKRVEDFEKKIDEKVNYIKRLVEEAGLKGVVFGLSGGLDSAVVAALCKRAFKDDAIGIIMPIHSAPQDEEDARLVAENTGINLKKVDLTKTFDAFMESVDETNVEMSIHNVKPRLRMTTLYYYAQSNSYMVVGSSNYSEYYTGYFTKHGDSGADIFPIVDLLKTDLFEMAKYLGLPEKIIDKKPSAGLFEGQTDEDEMGFTYEELDGYIMKEIKIDEKKKELIDRLHRINKHKMTILKEE